MVVNSNGFMYMYILGLKPHCFSNFQHFQVHIIDEAIDYNSSSPEEFLVVSAIT